MSREAMKLALEALENSRSLEPVDVQWVKGKRHAAITALREALAEQPAQQEPVAYWIPKAEQFCIASPSGRPFAKAWEPLYASPPAQRTWVGLTDEERVDLWKATETDNRMVLIEAIEAKLKEKNT